MISLLAQADGQVSFGLRDLMQPEILVFLIPIVAIVGGCVVTIIKTLVRHRERIAMIEAGFDPDARAHQEDSE